MDRRTLYSDVDDTLICHNLSDFPKEDRITIRCKGRSFDAVPHRLNLNLLIKFYKLGYDVHVWSKTGKSWAKAVVKALNIQQYVKSCLTKPDFLLDDKGADQWLGPIIYRNPKTGIEIKMEYSK